MDIKTAIKVVVLLSLASCQSKQEASQTTKLPATTKGDPVAGKLKYDTLCVSCHGPRGMGDGPAAASLNPKPRNLQATTRTDDELKKTIKLGGAAVGLSPLMVPWGGVLNDTDIDNVVAYICSLKP